MRFFVMPILLLGIIVWGCGSDEGQVGDKESPEEAIVNDTIPLIKQAGQTIEILSPDAGTTLSPSGFTIKGEAQTFEGQIHYRLVYDTLITLDHGPIVTTAGEEGKPESFTQKITYTSDWEGPALLEIYDEGSSSEGNNNVITIPVMVQKTTSGDSLADSYSYFTNRTMKTSKDCFEVYPIRRESPQTDDSLRMALYQLLRGPTVEEEEKGYKSRLPEGLILYDVAVEDGLAKVDFSHHFHQISGRCRTNAVRSQVEQTLYQFADIRAVVISVEGKQLNQRLAPRK